jgi:hypothetical protein
MRCVALGIAVTAALKGQTALDTAACKALPLAHASADVRERAATDLYFRCDRAALADPAVAANLMAGVRLSTPSAAGPVVLLGYVPEAAKEVLPKLAAASGPVKLQSWNQPVPVSAAVAVALSRLADPAAQERLKALSRDRSLATREFLIDVLRDVAPGDRALLLPYLDDNREIRSGIPSGAKPRRRLQDAAFYAFAKLLILPVAGLNESRRFSANEFEQWRPKMEAGIKSASTAPASLPPQ